MNNLDAFWNWVAINELRLLKFAQKIDGNEEVMVELHDFLHKVQPGLVCDIGICEKDESKRALVLSAEGDKSLFPAILRITDSAPKLKQFEVQAFRPRLKNNAAMVLNGLRVATDDLMVAIKKVKGEKVDLEVFMKDFDPSDERFEIVINLLIMHVLGEYKAVMWLKSVTISQWPDKENVKILPFIRLYDSINKIMLNN